MTGDLPMISDAAHSHTIYGLGNLTAGTNIAGTTTTAAGNTMMMGIGNVTFGQQNDYRDDLHAQLAQQVIPIKAKKENAMVEKPARRLVQVFIADPDENVPLDQSMLYSGEQKLTDATDQELFFEIDIKTVLAAHNAKRVTLINKKVKERTENLASF